MITSAQPIHLRPLPSLLLRREALVVRIAAARAHTAHAGRLVATDLRAGERTQRSILGGLKLLQATLTAGAVIWGLNATTRISRGSRFFTIALSVLSTMRALRSVRAYMLPLAPSSQRQE